jgi:hypothetical protein
VLVDGAPVIKNGEHTAAAYLRQVLDCASPLAVWGGVDDVAWSRKRGRGLPHSKTLRVPLQFNAAADFRDAESADCNLGFMRLEPIQDRLHTGHL